MSVVTEKPGRRAGGRSYTPQMPVEHRSHTRTDLPEVVEALASWEAGAGYAGDCLHAGDLGWYLRHPDEHVDGTVHSWWEAGRMVAVSIVEGQVARPRVAPDRLDDDGVASVVADDVSRLLPEHAWTDAQEGTAYRRVLLGRGWRPDEAWVVFHLDLDGTPLPATPGVGPTGDAVDERVALQRSGFERSTFTAEGWHRMAAAPGFRPELDLVARDADGTAVAAATAWSAGPGRCGLLEPVATHADHRGAGHGRRVVQAAVQALAASGAAAVRVATRQSNTSGVRLYESAGIPPVEVITTLTRGGA